MPDQTLLDKLMISKSTRLLVISAPHGYIDKITPLEEGVILSTVGELAAGKPYDFVQIFVRNRLDVMELAPAAPAVLSDDGALMTGPYGLAIHADHLIWKPISIATAVGKLY